MMFGGFCEGPRTVCGFPGGPAFHDLEQHLCAQGYYMATEQALGPAFIAAITYDQISPNLAEMGMCEPSHEHAQQRSIVSSCSGVQI